MQAIMKQLDFELERFDVTEESIETLFIGGGTPSAVDAALYRPFFEKITPFLSPDAEITTEANPNSATQAWLHEMYRLGANRVSFGVQSFHTEKLKLLGRNHTAKEAQEAPFLAKESGFENISIDLIYGTSFDTKKRVHEDITTAFTLPINHLSAYALTIEEGTKFFQKPEVRQDDENIAFRLAEEIKTHGFRHYEISNFGTYISRHNLGYWQYKDYIGIGSGAVGFLKKRRFYPTANIEAYIHNPLSHTTEQLDHAAIKSEKVLLGLRSIVGVELNILSPDERNRARHLIESDKLSLRNNRLYNNDFFLSDEMALYMLA